MIRKKKKEPQSLWVLFKRSEMHAIQIPEVEGKKNDTKTICTDNVWEISKTGEKSTYRFKKLSKSQNKKRKPTKETQCIIVKLLKTEVKGKKTEK